MYSMGQKVLAIQQLAFSAVMAISTELRVICCDFVSNLETLYQVADLNNNAAGLVSRDYRHGGIKIAVVNVQVRAADTARFD